MKLLKSTLIIILLILSFTESIGAQTFKPQPKIVNYIDRYNELAVKMMNEYFIPASIILSVAIMESAACESRNCKLLNNHFGIKTTKRYRIPGTKQYTIYKSYPNDTASYRHFCEWLMKKKFYQDICGINNAALWARAISKSGYTRSPTAWRKKVLSIIEKYNLSKYDSRLE